MSKSNYGGWVKLHRAMRDWQHIKDAKTVQVFMYLLIRASSKSVEAASLRLEAGQLVTSRKELADALGLKDRSVRTVLDKLIASGEISVQASRKNSLITINKWADFQGKNSEKSRQQNDQQNDQAKSQLKSQLNGQQTTTANPLPVKESAQQPQQSGQPESQPESQLKGQQNGQQNDHIQEDIRSLRSEGVAHAHTRKGNLDGLFTPDELRKEFHSSQQWQEQNMMAVGYLRKLSFSQMAEMINRFCDKLLAQEEGRTLRDAKKYFNSWLIIQLEKENKAAKAVTTNYNGVDTSQWGTYKKFTTARNTTQN